MDTLKSLEVTYLGWTHPGHLKSRLWVGNAQVTNLDVRLDSPELLTIIVMGLD
jgi:hypothetical protein